MNNEIKEKIIILEKEVGFLISPFSKNGRTKETILNNTNLRTNIDNTINNTLANNFNLEISEELNHHFLSAVETITYKIYNEAKSKIRNENENIYIKLIRIEVKNKLAIVFVNIKSKKIDYVTSFEAKTKRKNA